MPVFRRGTFRRSRSLPRIIAAVTVLTAAVTAAALSIYAIFPSGAAVIGAEPLDSQAERPHSQAPAPRFSPSPPARRPDISTVVMTFAGDCMMASMRGGYEFNSFNLFASKTEPSYFFKEMAPLFTTDDFTVVNCENVFTDRQLTSLIKDYEPAYWYKSPSAFAEIFTIGSVEVASIANNHIYDYGEEGREDTIAALENAGVIWGDSTRPLYLEAGGITIALLCEQITRAGYIDPILRKLENPEEDADYTVVFFHGGTEHSYQPEEPIERACRALIDAGADLVIGHHPHVLQPVEEYSGKVIVYSLGNFLFGGGVGVPESAVYRLTLTAAGGEVVSADGEVIPCFTYTENKWQPAPADGAAAAKIADFMRKERERPY